MSDNRTDIEIIDFSNLPKREPARQEAPRGGQSNDGNTPRRKKKKMTRKQKILQVTGRVSSDTFAVGNMALGCYEDSVRRTF